jgi:hypothetical protein
VQLSGWQIPLTQLPSGLQSASPRHGPQLPQLSWQVPGDATWVVAEGVFAGLVHSEVV